MILMAGQKISAADADAWGLVDQICDPDALMPLAKELCGDVLAATPAHASAIKAMIPARGAVNGT
jgi:enoyl-CoA hydratase/carnithine racemase